MPSRRTIRKPTLWTPEEWRRIEDAAQLRRVPPLRHVREAALAAQLPPAADRRGAHALMGQFHRVLNNLRQLLRLAEADGAQAAGAALERTIRSGAGISPENLPRVFERFWSGGKCRGCAGLGLAISRAIVQAHGGEMTVDSQPGQGATFTFTLPLAGA